jgi:phosphatidylserine decarboxylase
MNSNGNFMKILFILAQYLVPQHLLSRLVGKIADCEWPWLKNAFIDWFIKRYNVNMSEAADPEPRNYKNFNAFFTRALQAGARPIHDNENAVVLPADGSISQIGTIKNDRVFQAKGQDYSLLELIGGDQKLAAQFENGSFATVYLSPKDYHRVHMPLTGALKSMTYIPGDLFSVNETTANNVPNLFARNERAVCIFETEAGPMAVILVGAMIVAGIETVWAGQIAPLKRQVMTTEYLRDRRPIVLEKGEEMGRFKLGSTAIVLFGKEAIDWNEELIAGAATRMGEHMGQTHVA